MLSNERICAYIDLDALMDNLRMMQKKLPSDTKVCVVVKADAYGHGAVPASRMAQPLPFVWGFAVACMSEAVQLRNAGITKPILILGYLFPEDFSVLPGSGIRTTVFDSETARLLSACAMGAGVVLPVHIAVNTGMTRIGIDCTDHGQELIREIAALPGLVIEGIFTHFARADEKDKSNAMAALRRFNEFCFLAEDCLPESVIRHCANSAAILELPESHMDMVRAGISFYGSYPSCEMSREQSPLKPVMSLISHIVCIRDVPEGTPVSYGGTFVTSRPSKIATIPVGYADGYPRSLSSHADVLIRGRRAPIIGRVCMDQMMADVTDIPAALFDKVTLLGRDGEEEINLEELDEKSGRFPYEFTCCVSQRVPRVYLGGA